MRRADTKYLLLFALLVFIQFADAAAPLRRRRDDDDDSKGNWVERLRDWSKAKIPGLGRPIAGSIQMGLNGWSKSQDLTNGAVGRLLGGMFPCTLTKTAFTCTGVTMDSDFADVIMWFLNPMPGFVLPQFGKDLINAITQLSVPVTMDFLFGGVKTDQPS